jgi:calcineurin-like phosphoesterase family protein
MANIFVISDTHFGHSNILNFKGYDDKPLRVFDNVEQMNECMIEKWNSVVTPQDKIYHLGDVIMRCDKPEKILGRLNGHKRLILGNHDLPKIKVYTPFFERFYSTRLLDKILLSHIPVHPLSLGKAIANVHGHVHFGCPDFYFGKQYYNVCVEVIDYTPIEWGDLKQRIQKRLALNV